MKAAASPSVVPFLPTERSLRQKAARNRSINRKAEPADFINLILESETNVLKDFQTPDGKRVLILGTWNHFDQLVKSKMIFMDGTFRAVSKLVYQLYTFHGFLCNKDKRKTEPLVYCIAPDKREIPMKLFSKLLFNSLQNEKLPFVPNTQ
jgi:hypothetical protein